MNRAAACLSLLVLLVPACADAPRNESPSGPASIVLHVGDVEIQARVAMTHEARRRGLQGVARLAATEGMLLVYRRPGTRSIWMKDTLVALDVAFLDARGRILQLVTLPPPAGGEAEPARARSRGPSQYVLEMPAGFFARHGLGVGTRVVLPTSVDPSQADL